MTAPFSEWQLLLQCHRNDGPLHHHDDHRLRGRTGIPSSSWSYLNEDDDYVRDLPLMGGYLAPPTPRVAPQEDDDGGGVKGDTMGVMGDPAAAPTTAWTAAAWTAWAAAWVVLLTHFSVWPLRTSLLLNLRPHMEQG